MPLIEPSSNQVKPVSNDSFWKRYAHFLIPLIVVILTGLAYTGLAVYQQNKTEENVKKVGKIVEKSKQDGVTAWLVDTAHGKDVVYTSNDGRVMFTGQAFNSETGDAMFTKFSSQAVPKDQVATQPQESAKDEAAAAAAAGQDDLTPGQALGKWSGETPKAFQILDTLKGFKIGDAAAADTVYIMYDPRCPYCHKLLERTKSLDLKAKGIAIKWLPTVALGSKGLDSPEVKRAAVALHSTNPEEFFASFDNASQGVAATEADNNELSKNLAFLYDAAKQTFGDDAPIAVPAAFFLDKKTGTPRMVYAAQEDKIYRSIFGD